MTVTAENRAVARHLCSIFESKGRVIAYGDEAEKSSVDIIIFDDTPTVGMTTASTVNLANTDIQLYAGNKSLRVELINSFNSDQFWGANVLATCAFNLINTGMIPQPGHIFLRVLEMYDNSDTQHILFCPPFVRDIASLHFDSRIVTWLAAIPITQQEYLYSLANGTDALEALLEDNDVDVFDLRRRSIV